jgi:hypothetical protein
MQTPRSPFSVRHAGDAAPGADGGLRVAGRERVAARVGAGALDDREIRVDHPGSRHAEDELERLIERRAEKADQKEVVAAALAHAPEHEQRRDHEHGLAAELGDALHDGVPERRARAPPAASENPWNPSRRSHRICPSSIARFAPEWNRPGFLHFRKKRLY